MEFTQDQEDIMEDGESTLYEVIGVERDATAVQVKMARQRIANLLETKTKNSKLSCRYLKNINNTGCSCCMKVVKSSAKISRRQNLFGN